MQTITLLTQARALIANPNNWIKYDLSNGMGGYCARGALMACVSPQESEIGAKALYEAMTPSQKDRSMAEIKKFYPSLGKIPVQSGQHLAAINNSGTHEEVLALFDLAIARQLVIDSMANPIEVSEPVDLRAALLVGV